MNKQQAEYVRSLVCVGCSPVAIVRHFDRKYPGERFSEEGSGWLVVKAALILDESPHMWRHIAKLALPPDQDE